MRNKLQRIFILIIALTATKAINAQDIKTSYFMDNAYMKSSLNPAIHSNVGYFSLPVIGGMGLTFQSNSLTAESLFFKDGNGNLLTFLDSSIDSETFLSGLADMNTIDIDANANIFSFGWYSPTGKSFWSFDSKLRTTVGLGIPLDFFRFAKEGMTGDENYYSFEDLSVQVTSYAEVGLGYSHQVNERLTVGLKFKYLIGIADIDLNIDKMDINLSSTEWNIEAEGSIEGTLQGLQTQDFEENGVTYFDSYDFAFEGVSGSGVAFDFGMEYKVTDRITISAAVVDLGSISWNEESTIKGVSAANYSFAGFSEDMDSDDMLDSFGNLTRFEKTEAASRKTKLRHTFNLGLEVDLLDSFSVGALYSSQRRDIENYNELTISGNWHPFSLLNATLSYSALNSSMNTFGAAVCLNPGFINIFVGTDYMIGEVSAQYIPINQKIANFYFGVSIPMSKSASLRGK